jgi:transcriptional regulator with XRE-family HTH domain
MITKPKIQIDLAKVESLAANGLTQEQIASALGISETTLHQRKRDSADFAAAIKRGKAKGIALVTNKLMESIKGGNMTGMIFFLKTQAGWKETNVQEHTGANGGAIQVNTTAMSAEEAYNLLINGGTIKTD